MQQIATRESIELFHLIFLDHLGRKIDKSLYSLKGGCNLRFYFKSIRYSEDIDIDVFTISKQTLEKNIDAILASAQFERILKAQGLQLTAISKPKQTDTTQRWKLQILTPNSTIPCPTKIEFSRREIKASTQFGAIDPALIRYYRLTPILSTHYDGEVALKQKILALILRTETQARDIFDIHLLQNQGYSIDRMQFTSEELEQAKQHALSIDFDAFKSQVVAYLEKDYQDQYQSQEYWDDIVLAVIQSLEGKPDETD